MTICTIDDCESRVLARGWCSMHYQRWRTSLNRDVRITNMLGAVIVGDSFLLPTCPDCLNNGYVMSWDGDGSYVCLADSHALRVFVSPPAPETRGPLAVPTAGPPSATVGRAGGPTS